MARAEVASAVGGSGAVPGRPSAPTDRAPARAGFASCAGALAARHDVALLDLDGVVYVGPAAVEGAVGLLDSARQHGMRLGYVTNNASRTPATVAAHLRDLGLTLDDDDVVTSAQAAARLVAARVPAGARVLVVGGEGLVHALAEHGLNAVESLADQPAAVVQGFAPTVGWASSPRARTRSPPACRGSPATWTAPSRPPAVGHLATGRWSPPSPPRPAPSRLVAGKPEPALLEESVLRMAAADPLMVGDRLDTDISGAVRYGMPSLLVLTGVTSLDQLCRAVPGERPDYVAADLGGLLDCRTPRWQVDGGQTSCAGWTVRVIDGRFEVDPPADAEDAGVAALRAVVAAAWRAYDDGAPDIDVAVAAAVLRDTVPVSSHARDAGTRSR